MPQYRNYELVPLHGEGTMPVGSPATVRGGIFGQPSMPPGRTGIFKTKYNLPEHEQVDDTASALPSDQAGLPSGYPIRYLIPKAAIGRGLGGPLAGLEAIGAIPLAFMLGIAGLLWMAHKGGK